MELGPIHYMTPEEFAEHLEGTSEEEWAALVRERFRTHADEFCQAMWPERFTLPFNEFHHWLFEKQLLPPWNERTEDVRDAIAAPRGFGKSAIATFARLVHDIVYDREAYILILSSESKLALDFSRDLRTVFTKENSESLLHRLYGPFKITGGVKGWEVSVKGRPSIGICPVSALGAIRGKKHPTRGIRPTKVLLDDAENRDRVRNPEQRALWWKWLTNDVLRVGRREKGTIYEFVGTVLHMDSGLARCLKKVGWKSRRWQAMPKWPERRDLWERCRTIWCDLALGEHRVTMARAFYRAHKAEMDKGAEILDPASKDLFELHEIIWTEGISAFLQELQNDPVDPTAQIFVSANFTQFTVEGNLILVRDQEGKVTERIPLDRLEKYGYWDPATGSPGGDFAAIAVLGRDEWGRTYVLDVWMRRAKPSEQLETCWLLSERWKCPRFTVESVNFQGLVAEPYERQCEERRKSGRYWKLDLIEEKESSNKELRLSTMEPDVTNGWMRFNTSIPSEVLQQFDAFPTGDHDDGMDAIHGAWRSLGGTPVEMAE